VSLARRHLGEVEQFAHQLDKCPCGTAYATILRAEAAAARGDTAQGRTLLDQAIALAPQMVWPRLVLAEWLMRADAPLSDRIAAHRDILRLDPGHAGAKVALEMLLRQERGEREPVSSSWFTITT